MCFWVLQHLSLPSNWAGRIGTKGASMNKSFLSWPQVPVTGERGSSGPAKKKMAFCYRAFKSESMNSVLEGQDPHFTDGEAVVHRGLKTF